MNHLRVVAVIATVTVTVMGCGGGAKKSTTPKPSPCIAVASHVSQVFGSEATATAVSPAEVAEVVEAIRVQCQGSPWSATAIECINKSTTMQELNSCEQYIAPAQPDAVGQGVDARRLTKQSNAEDTMEGGTGASDGSPKGGDGSSADPCGGDE